MMWGDWFGIGGFFMMLMMVLFWGLIIAGIVFAVRAFSGPGGYYRPEYRREERTDALEILKERYARGEIDTAEYEEKKRQLAS
jgi:putative membrane protein